jgi:predicted RNase H-like HicB family nuclease
LEVIAVKLRIVLDPSDEGGYTVYVPSLPGCISEGDNMEEALAIFSTLLIICMSSIPV